MSSNDADTPTAATAAAPKHDTDLGGNTAIAETEGLFSAYDPSLPGPEHPTALVETSTLSFSRPPCDSAHLHTSLAASPALSAAQMEVVCLARMRNEDGNKALLIADATGVGKGREPQYK